MKELERMAMELLAEQNDTIFSSAVHPETIAKKYLTQAYELGQQGAVRKTGAFRPGVTGLGEEIVDGELCPTCGRVSITGPQQSEEGGEDE